MKMPYKIIFYLFVVVLLNSFLVDGKWYFYESKLFGFKIEFPQKPVVTNENVQTELGVLKVNNIVYDPTVKNKKDENLTYLVNYIEYPIAKVNSSNKQQLQAIYKNAIASAVENASGKLNKVQISYVKGYEARDVMIDLPDNVCLSMRVVLVYNKMYMIQVFCNKNKILNSSMKKFVNSFDLV